MPYTLIILSNKSEIPTVQLVFDCFRHFFTSFLPLHVTLHPTTVVFSPRPPQFFILNGVMVFCCERAMFFVCAYLAFSLLVLVCFVIYNVECKSLNKCQWSCIQWLMCVYELSWVEHNTNIRQRLFQLFGRWITLALFHNYVSVFLSRCGLRVRYSI